MGAPGIRPGQKNQAGGRMGPPLRDLLQSGLRKHLQELALGAHVDGLRDQFACAVVDEAFGDAFHLERFGDFAAGVEQNRIADFPFGDKWRDLRRVLVGNGQYYEGLVFKSVEERIEVGHFFAAGRAPGRPEVYEHDLAAQILQVPLLALQVGQREIDVLADGIVGFELGHGCGELRIV